MAASGKQTTPPTYLQLFLVCLDERVMRQIPTCVTRVSNTVGVKLLRRATAPAWEEPEASELCLLAVAHPPKIFSLPIDGHFVEPNSLQVRIELARACATFCSKVVSPAYLPGRGVEKVRSFEVPSNKKQNGKGRRK